MASKRTSGVASPEKPQVNTKKISRNEGLSILAKFQRYMAITLIASAALGAYLLVTDHSLWLLASSHAYGLVFIIIVDIALSALNFRSIRQAYIPTMAWAVLTFILQLGDIFTAPQYKMTIPYFANYLFGLWAFDSLLAAQIILAVIGLYGREYLQYKAKKKQLSYFDMTTKSSRRDFLQIGGGIALLVAITSALGIAYSLDSSQPKNPSQSSSGQTTGSLPSGAIANVKDLATLSPVYFEFPTGYPNVLLKKSDGTVSALSMLCTHVCCQCQFDSSSSKIYCPCHGSLFDQSGNVLNGPASSKLPSIDLSIDSSGNVFPVKVVGSGPCISG